MRDCILERLDSHGEDILQLTEALVSVPTENPPGRAYRECVEVIRQALDRTHLESTLLEIPAHGGPGEGLEGMPESHPRYCVVGGYGRGERVLYFHGHYDVVPAAGEEQYAPERRDGKLFGRGTADMKGGLAAMIYAAGVLRECGVELNGRVGLVFVPDEETGGAGGSQWLSEMGLLGKNGIGMLTPEPTGGVIWSGSRGALSLRVTVKGKAAHVARHQEGVNAFERMLTVADRLMELRDEVETRETGYRIEPKTAQRSILMLGGECRSGAAFNTVPARCSFTVDRRLNPEEDLETEKRRLFSLIEGLRREGNDLDVEILQEGESSGVSETDPLAEVLAAVVAEVAGGPARFELCPGLLETRFYTRQGVSALGYGPGLLTVSHGPDEYVEIEKLRECAAIYALTALRFLAT